MGIKSFFKTVCPRSVLRGVMVARDMLVSLFSGVARAPLGTDWVRYERLIGFIRKHGVLTVPGDMVEIGTFLGGGAMKLSRMLERLAPDKKLFVIDVFDPTFDWTHTTEDKPMAELYHEALKGFHGKTQMEVFRNVTKGCCNIVVLAVDSREAKPQTEKLCFGFIDGNHAPEYVESDFYLVWKLLSPGGVVAFHDYDPIILPQTKAKIDELAERHRNELAMTEVDADGLIFYTLKR